MPLNGDIQRELKALLRQQEKQGKPTIEVSALEMCRRTLSREPDAGEISIAAAVLQAAMQPDAGDEAIAGKDEANLTVRYTLPRPKRPQRR